MTGWDLAPEVALRARQGSALDQVDCRATPGWSAGKVAARAHMARRGRDMATLQEMLYAHGRTGGDRAVLLVLQGMDTSGKGGVVRHVIGMVDPQGVALRAFGVPTRQEAEQHYLWRVRRALPPPGHLGVFDRSHYEDVLVARVDGLVPPSQWQGRFEEINAFEQEVAATGTVVVKVLLAISREEQAERLRRRLERPHKHWKYVPGDVDARARWDDYVLAYQDVLDRTSTPVAPWHVVPADRKWYARLAVTELVAHALEGLDLQWPVAGFDVGAELARLEATT
ncbi:PPK2 family polyphosphate kinase [Cellulomonas bogoriensis]|uniref:Phosphate:nucleotide phosphotransferase n=1 Tax=Cellulomonas bogoriensis 69B4 = DSM 16987 TaxID=1386082 RepID=A0A0A0C1H7_9CELL|nr:PPK2 family polyphosphate kinase [Cellulomonas bogoriensis]KGM13214.1 phosphate:nucleotide phosphotransferase [Cellulomonas bogoriensis 69B4 = DSM 16987]